MKSREFLISDILDVSWGDTKTTKSAYVESGYIAYSAAGPDGFLPNADYDCDGVVLSAIGANCGVTYLASGQWSCIKNTIRILPKTSDIDIKYFYYLSCSPDFWPKRGSAQPFISQTDIRDLRIQIPPVETQKAIVGIIEQLDHKIKVNQQIASTLEQIAQTIFKSWFVDFDPVHAKARGEQPVGMDAETAALFPDSLEESELGPIPSGWSISSVVEKCDFKPGTPFKSNLFNSEGQGKPVIRIRDLNNHSSKTYTTEVNTKGFLAEAGTLLVGMDGTFEAVIWRGVPSLVNQRISELKPKDGISGFFVKFSISKELKLLERNATGTTVGHLSKGEIERLKLINPGSELDYAYSAIANPLSEEISTLTAQNRTLATIRDSLLPRLISGELEIPAELLEA